MTYTRIKKAFEALPPEEQEQLFTDLYHFSSDTRRFLETRLLGSSINSQEFIDKMQKATIDKIYRKGIPGMISTQAVRSIIKNAERSRVDTKTMLTLYQLAYRGYIEFLNEFGGGPDNYDEWASTYLESYLHLIKTTTPERYRQLEVFQDVQQYLLKKNNMFTDAIDEMFESVTGLKMHRY